MDLPVTSIPIERYEAFRWEVLEDAAMEDWQGLWEPLEWANSVLRDLSIDDRIGAAEQAMRELFADGLILFVDQGEYAGQPWQERILSADEVDAAISSTTWRKLPLLDWVTVWFAGTEAGKAAVEEHWATLKKLRAARDGGSDA